ATGCGDPTTLAPISKNRSTTSMASISGIAASTSRRKRSPGGLASRPRGSASRASETRAWSTAVAHCSASSSQVFHSPNRSLDGWCNDGRFGEPNFGDGSAEDGALHVFETQEQPSNGKSLVGRTPRREREDFAKVRLLGVVGGAIGPANLAPISVAVDFPR